MSTRIPMTGSTGNKQVVIGQLGPGQMGPRQMSPGQMDPGQMGPRANGFPDKWAKQHGK